MAAAAAAAAAGAGERSSTFSDEEEVFSLQPVGYFSLCLVSFDRSTREE